MTTITKSAKAAGLPDRRRFLSTVAGVGALGLTVLPAASTADGDAHLFELESQLARLNELAAEADRQLNIATDAYERAFSNETPEPLFVRPDDNLVLRRRPEIEKGKPTGRLSYDTADIEKVAAAFPAMEKLHGDADSIAAMSRLREIVQSYRSWRMASRAAWDAAGVEAAEVASEEAHRKCMELRSRIAQCPATTMAGVMLKARILVGDDAEDYLGDLIDGSMDGMAFSIACDLIGICNGDTAYELHA